METADWVPDDVDTTVPSAARVYDFLLGGGHHFAADRMVGKAVLEVQPHGREIARSNRAFLGRAVRFLIDNGITQFLDLGSGIPTVGNVHEVAQKASPDSRVVYVDNDQVAVAHSQLMLAGNEHAAMVNADLRKPETVLSAPQVHDLLDFTRPIGLLTVAVFHFVADSDDPHDVMAQYVAALPAGSFVALSHLTADQMPGEMAGVVEAMKNSRNPMYFRRHAEVAALFDGLEFVEPGLVTASSWRNDGYGDGQEGVYAGIGRKL